MMRNINKLNYYFEHCPLSRVLSDEKFQKLDLFPSSCGRKGFITKCICSENPVSVTGPVSRSMSETLYLKKLKIDKVQKIIMCIVVYHNDRNVY
jgi:hypothetical protein